MHQFFVKCDFVDWTVIREQFLFPLYREFYWCCLITSLNLQAKLAIFVRKGRDFIALMCFSQITDHSFALPDINDRDLLKDYKNKSVAIPQLPSWSQSPLFPKHPIDPISQPPWLVGVAMWLSPAQWNSKRKMAPALAKAFKGSLFLPYILFPSTSSCIGWQGYKL